MGIIQTIANRSYPRGSLRGLGFVVCCLPLSACATLPDDPAERAEILSLNDPFEPANRQAYEFNRVLNATVLAPLNSATGDPVIRPIRGVVHNVLQNLREPMTFANDLLQGHECAAGQTLRRFMVNSTLGVAGLFDVAKSHGNLDSHDNDFGVTLGVWGVPAGPYLVLPALGPTDARGVAGTAVEYFADPVDIAWTQAGGATWVTYTRGGLDALDKQSESLKPIAVIEKTSLDPYAAVRSAYRENLADQMKGPDCVTYAQW